MCPVSAGARYGAAGKCRPPHAGRSMLCDFVMGTEGLKTPVTLELKRLKSPRCRALFTATQQSIADSLHSAVRWQRLAGSFAEASLPLLELLDVAPTPIVVSQQLRSSQEGMRLFFYEGLHGGHPIRLTCFEQLARQRKAGGTGIGIFHHQGA